MRLWSLHPKYLDAAGLVAVWREGLLAQAVLRGQTKGYRNHPQLARFRDTPSPVDSIAAYLHGIFAEAERRGYHFAIERIASHGPVGLIDVPLGQVQYEWQHLSDKLQRRSPDWFATLKKQRQREVHSLFRVVAGKVADWEKISR